MSLLKKSFGFMVIFGIVVVANAAPTTPTARPSIIANASARMPTMTAKIGNNSNASSAAATSTTLADQECISAYTDCVKGADACGTGFEECTNKTLFYAKKSNCASTLLQCKASGINALFGTSNTTSFANKDSKGEFSYPTNGSVLGQLIESAAINNRYDTSNCVKKYASCLKKDDVCGSDFELCTTNTEFKKQKLFCESTLARCQDEGKKELFGTTTTTANPTGDSRIGIMITEGAALAAVNSVATCYKIADNCMLSACATNPYKCKEATNRQKLCAAADIVTPDQGDAYCKNGSDTITGEPVNRNDISGFIKKECFDTIGASKFCYATFIGNGVMPTSSQLKDEDNRDTIFSEAYSSRMNDSMKSKINDLIDNFDAKTKKRCSDTIVACAMRSCGGGSGAACYASAFNTSNSIKGVTNPSTLADIKYGCEAQVNNDASCKYAGATFQTATGVLSFLDNESLFDTLFTAPDNKDASKPDPVGAVASLNAKLSTSYNQAALDNMKRQCQSIATGCVKSLCGADYENCYRNRTDVYSTLTKSGNTSFDKSMNKVGGVLDHTIVLGLCMNTVKNNPVCEEHIKSEAARRIASVNGTVSNANSWGAGINDTRSGWLDAGNFSATSTGNIQDVDADGNLLCTTMTNNGGDVARCDDVSGKYIYPKMVSEGAYNIAQTERTVFRDLIYDLEIEAQAKYNAKLTKQQNMCLSGNTGGIIGDKNSGGTFMWAKLKNGKVPSNYAASGLTTSQFVASNDLYGSFCRVRVTLQSDDKRIQDEINSGKDWGVAYFAAGDTFTCGSWIPGSALESISEKVAGAKTGTDKDGKLKSGQSWAVAGMSVLGAAGGYLGTDALQKGGLGGLLGTNNNQQIKVQDACKSKFQSSIYELGGITSGKKVVQREMVKGYATYKLEADTTEGADAKAEAEKRIKEMQSSMNSACGDEKQSSALGKTLVNVGGAAIGGTILGVGTAQIMKSSNRSNFTAEQQKWMDEVGQHIRCYIGAEEVGMYSDIISTEME